MNEEVISVVIPAYRAARTIARALDSLLAQTHPANEILVIDDGSPDDLATVIRAYGDRVTLLRKANGGAASARNLGIDNARGNFIAFLDADDYWAPNKLERQLEVFRRHPEVGLVSSRWYTQEPSSPNREVALAGNYPHDEVIAPSGAEAFRIATCIWTSTILVRRDVLGSHRFTSGLEPAEDRDLWVRLVAAAPMCTLSEPLATCVLEPGSLSRSNVDVDYGNMLRVIHRHANLMGKRSVRRWEARTFGKWAAGHLAQGRPRAAIRPAWRRLSYQPWSLQGWWVMLKSGLLACATSQSRKPREMRNNDVACTNPGMDKPCLSRSR
jgi:glycosyltransferase involved in cell wall biosynthesis